MPKVNPIRDDLMATNGYLRATVVAKIFNLSTSTVGKWPTDKVGQIRANGLNWVNWVKAREFRALESAALKLSSTASEVLAWARTNKII